MVAYPKEGEEYPPLIRGGAHVVEPERAAGGQEDMAEETEQSPGGRGPRFPSSKFTVPRVGSRLVHRARLLDRLDRRE